MTARSVSDLAADVEQGFSDYLNYHPRKALAELVARLETAEAEAEEKLEAAEAQVAALTQERDELRRELGG